MSPLATLLLVLINSLPICWADRGASHEVKQHQFETIATAIATVAKTDDEAVLLLTVAYHESRLCLRTHAGEKRFAKQKSLGLFQIEKGSRLPPPYAGLSLADTTAAASAALDLLRRSWQCGRTAGDRMTAYAGRPCGDWPSRRARENTFWVLSSRLARERRADRLAAMWERVA